MSQLPVRSAFTRAQGALRTYADSPFQGENSAGATSADKGWKNREQASENQYVIQHEREKLQKLRESLEKQQKVVDSLDQEKK